jgi:phenylacetate-coenzyme A ligase PaaK-like adenylate-forming protein
MNPELKERIFTITSSESFTETALEIFRYQAEENAVYSTFINSLRILPERVRDLNEIPFLPVEFFKSHNIISGKKSPEKIFESSGTSGQETSRHYITDLAIYEESFTGAFRIFYGNPEEYLIAALLPSYTERANSSLVFMVEKLIGRSRIPGSGFYKPENVTSMLAAIENAYKENKNIILLGVSFALLELAEKHQVDLSEIIIMETGGMKGRRKEITREELHKILKSAFKASSIHSEYGMTELLSQAYSKGEGLFRTPPWMKVLIRESQDPLAVSDQPGMAGGINIIDLANVNSCSFIATGDLGRINPNETFEVLGRLDNSDIRGCNLLIQ